MHDSNYARTRFSPCHGRIRADSRTVTLELTPRGNRRKRMKINSAILLTGAGLLSALSLSVLRSQPHDTPGPVVPKDMLSSEPLFLPQYQGEELGEEMKLTANGAYDFRPQILATSRGQVWVVWERSSKERGMQIVAKYFNAGTWSEEIKIEDRQGYAYRPSLVESSDGSVWVAWDHTVGANA